MNFILILISIPIILGICIVEYMLLRVNNKLALIIPVLSVVSIIPLGIVGITLTIITFLIYFIGSYVLDKRKNRQKEVEKMLIRDL